MPKRYLTGGGNLKNQNNSNDCVSKDSNKSRKFFSKFCKKVKNLYQKLTSFRYDKVGGAGFRAQEDYESDIFKYSLTTVFREIKKIIKELKSKLSDRSTLIPPAGASCRGSILIEFAVCMPILIILLFYIHDLIKIKRYYSQTEFIGQQMANILQNISKNQPITLTNIKHACALAWLSFPRDSSNIRAITNIYYIGTKIESAVIPTHESCGCTKGQHEMSWDYDCGGGFARVRKTSGIPSMSEVQTACDEEKRTAQSDYEYFSQMAEDATDPDDIEWYLRMAERSRQEIGDCNNCVLRTNSAFCYHGISSEGYGFFCGDVASYQTQQTDPGKAACAWGIGLYRSPDGLWTKDGDTISSDKTSSTVRWGQNVEPSAIHSMLKVNDDKGKIIVETQFRLTSGSARTAFGLHLVNPPSKVPDGSMYFSSVVIFQPKSGLFSVTAPT